MLNYYAGSEPGVHQMPQKNLYKSRTTRKTGSVTPGALTFGVRQAAEASGLSQRYLRDKLMTGELKSVRVGSVEGVKMEGTQFR
jgi:hypothetical protein